MAAKLTTVADAVATLLSAPVTPVTTAGGTVERKWLPRRDLKDAEPLLVTVVGRSTARSRVTRSDFALDHTIDVGVQRRRATGQTDEALTDANLEIAENVAGFLEDNELAAASGARLLTVQSTVTWSDDHLERFGMFTAVATAVYRTMR